MDIKDYTILNLKAWKVDNCGKMYFPHMVMTSPPIPGAHLQHDLDILPIINLHLLFCVPFSFHWAELWLIWNICNILHRSQWKGCGLITFKARLEKALWPLPCSWEYLPLKLVAALWAAQLPWGPDQLMQTGGTVRPQDSRKWEIRSTSFHLLHTLLLPHEEPQTRITQWSPPVFLAHKNRVCVKAKVHTEGC